MRQETTCHKCLRGHSRGPINGEDVYRCLHCGITYKRLDEDPQTDLTLRIRQMRAEVVDTMGPNGVTGEKLMHALVLLAMAPSNLKRTDLDWVAVVLLSFAAEVKEDEGARKVWQRRVSEAEGRLATARAEERKWFGDYCRRILGGLALDLFVADDFVEEMLKMREGIEKYPYEVGDPIWYKPSLDGREFAGVVDSELRPLGDSFVLRLREMEPDYARIHHPGSVSRTTVKAASVHSLRPRGLCVCGHKLSRHEPKPSTEVLPEVLACTVTDCACGPGCIHEGYVDADTGG